MESEYAVSAIGRVRSCFVEKFGIPRQSGLADDAVGELELLAPYCRPEFVRGLEGASHIWIVFLFHGAIEEGWQSTVRPPRLGGRRRLGVFATRSPHRPNHIGQSVVRLISVREIGGKTILCVAGLDVLDGTPIIDIKPYVPYADCITEATLEAFERECTPIATGFSAQADRFCKLYRLITGRNLRRLIEQILTQDPRPASQRRSRKSFGITLWNVNVRWRVHEAGFLVERCSRDERRNSSASR